MEVVDLSRNLRQWGLIATLISLMWCTLVYLVWWLIRGGRDRLYVSHLAALHLLTAVVYTILASVAPQMSWLNLLHAFVIALLIMGGIIFRRRGWIRGFTIWHKGLGLAIVGTILANRLVRGLMTWETIVFATLTLLFAVSTLSAWRNRQHNKEL